MRSRIGAIAWFITGAALGFGGLALAFASLGAIMLLAALPVVALLLVFRVRPASMLLVGAGSGIGIPWGLHITSGDTPDSQLWPLFVGLAVLVAGLLLSRYKAGPGPAQPKGARSI